MMLINSFVIVVGISVVHANVRDVKRTRRSAENPDVIGSLPEGVDGIKADLDVQAMSVVIDENGDEILDEKADQKLDELIEYEESLDDHPTDPAEVPNYSIEDDWDDADDDEDADVDATDDDDDDDTPVNSRRKRAAFNLDTSLWEKAIVPYVFDESTGIGQDHARAVMNYVEQATCIRYIPYKPGMLEEYGLSHENVLRFGEYNGCNAAVGQGSHKISKNDTQRISLCAADHGVAMHEMFHSLGSQHEQHRSDKNSIFQIYLNNVNPGDHREVNSYMNTNNTYAYSLDSIMQYGPQMGSLNGKLTMITYDKDLAHMYSFRDGFVQYLDAKIINSIYKCQERRCPNHPHKCKNRGYVAYVNHEKCRCVCPRGLGGDTCEEEYVPEPIGSWPSGSYCLAADNTECSGTPLLTGYRKEHFNELHMYHFKYYYPKDAYNRSQIYTHRFCCNDKVGASAKQSVIYDWPRGTYCIYMYKDKCPSGFTIGSLRFDDANKDNQNELGGDAYPSGVYDSNITEFRYCCRDDGALEYPMVMQNQKPFTLLPGKFNKKCQEVAGMLAQRMMHMFKPKMNLTTSTAPHPFSESWYGLTWYYTCHYSPRKHGCGGVEILTDDRRSVTIKSPNYPNTYSSNTVCSWTIKSPENTVMKVEFTRFNISVYSNGDCEYDFLEVRNWNPQSVGRKFCGVRFPRGILSYQNQMLLELQTSELTPATGFEATISIIDGKNLTYGSPWSYAGKVSYTQQYEKCLRWDEVPQCPHNMFSDTTSLLGPHNHCRNPVKEFSRPWCYVDANCYTDVCDVSGLVDCYDKSESCASLIVNASYCGSDTGFEHCHKSCGFCGQDVDKKPDVPECKLSALGLDYRGNKSVTKNGYSCQRWDTQQELPEAAMFEENYCRNPDNDPLGPWCYTTDPNKCWEHCGIPLCEDCKEPAVAKSMVMMSGKKDAYMSGDVITYREKYTNLTQERMCLTTGEWTGSDDMFSGCPYGWIESLPGRCYKYSAKSLTHNNAQKKCASYGGRLAIPATEVEQNALEVALPNPRISGFIILFGLAPNEWITGVSKWIDGRNLTYTKWRNSKIPVACAAQTTADGSYYWGDGIWCDWNYPYVCERFATCGDGYYASGDGVCYKYHGEDPKSRDDAQAVCESEGGQLAVGSTEQEHYAIVAVLPCPASESTNELNNGSPVQFTNSAPDNSIGTDRCVALRWIVKNRAHIWDDVDCSSKNRFVCQKSQVSKVKCSDSDKDCSDFKTSSTLCRQRGYEMLAYTNCRQTCGFCN